MKERSRSRFDSIEEAHEYVRIMREVVEETETMVLEETADATRERNDRYVDALRLVHYKLGQLREHLEASSRLLNDLRTLRRTLYGERARPK